MRVTRRDRGHGSAAADLDAGLPRRGFEGCRDRSRAAPGEARLPGGTEVLGPVPASDGQERMVLRVARGRAADLARALHEAAAVRSARKAALPVRVQIDPADLF